MLTEIFSNLINELKFGYIKRHHPFRYCTLATLSKDSPAIRTVVLRELTPEYNLIFFTDKRSEKIKQIILNPKSEALFYHPKKLFQIKVSGKIKIIQDKKRLEAYRRKIQDASTKDYSTLQPPGTPIKNPDLVDYGSELHFTALELQAEKIESLQLKRPNHIRCLFKKENSWKGDFLIP